MYGVVSSNAAKIHLENKILCFDLEMHAYSIAHFEENACRRVLSTNRSCSGHSSLALEKDAVFYQQSEI
jgi:hypothetical protein